MAPINGNIAGVGVPKLFRAVADEALTGRLTLSSTHHAAEAQVFFRDGDCYFARLAGSGVQVGTRLVSAGIISRDEVDRALVLQKSEDGRRRVGEILVAQAMISKSQLSEIVQRQLEDIVFEILRLESGTFRFEPDIASEEDIGLEVSVDNLVMEGTRRLKEWREIRRKVPTLEAVPRFSESASGTIEVALTPEEWSLVSHVDGESSVATLAKGCGFTNLEAARCVMGLLTAGLLVLELPEEHAAAEDLEEAYDQLQTRLDRAAAELNSKPEFESLADLASAEFETDEAPAIGNGSSVTTGAFGAILSEIAGPAPSEPEAQEAALEEEEEIQVEPIEAAGIQKPRSPRSDVDSDSLLSEFVSLLVEEPPAQKEESESTDRQGKNDSAKPEPDPPEAPAEESRRGLFRKRKKK